LYLFTLELFSKAKDNLVKKICSTEKFPLLSHDVTPSQDVDCSDELDYIEQTSLIIFLSVKIRIKKMKQYYAVQVKF